MAPLRGIAANLGSTTRAFVAGAKTQVAEYSAENPVRSALTEPPLPPAIYKDRSARSDGSPMLGALQPPPGRVAADNRPAAAPAPANAAVAAAGGTLSAGEVAIIEAGTRLFHKVPESRRIIEPKYDKTMRIIGEVLSAPLTFARWFVTLIASILAMVGKVLATIVLTAPVHLIGWFGVDVKAVIDVMKKVIAAPFGIVTGAIEGALRLPEAAFGVGFAFLRDLFSFRWIKDPELLLQTFAQPVLGAIATALAPLYYTLRGLDDAIFPPRKLSDEERKVAERDYDKSTLDRIRIHEKGILHALMWGEVGATTQDHDIYWRGKVEEHAAWPELLRHEIVHSLQVSDTPGGFPVFLSSYYAHFIANLTTSGGDMKKAYKNIPYEIEAYTLQGGVQ